MLTRKVKIITTLLEHRLHMSTKWGISNVLCGQVHLLGHPVGHADSCHSPGFCDAYNPFSAGEKTVMKTRMLIQ